jgi:hypothetical protein
MLELWSAILFDCNYDIENQIRKLWISSIILHMQIKQSVIIWNQNNFADVK